MPQAALATSVLPDRKVPVEGGSCLNRCRLKYLSFADFIKTLSCKHVAKIPSMAIDWAWVSGRPESEGWLVSEQTTSAVTKAP